MVNFQWRLVWVFKWCGELLVFSKEWGRENRHKKFRNLKKSFSRSGFYSPGIVIQLNTRLFLSSLDKIRLFRHEKRAKYTVVLNAPRTARPTICISKNTQRVDWIKYTGYIVAIWCSEQVLTSRLVNLATSSALRARCRELSQACHIFFSGPIQTWWHFLWCFRDL